MLRLYLYARVRLFAHLLHTRPRVQQAPGIPCALLFFGAIGFLQTSGETRRENAEVCSMPATVIASEAKQSISPRKERMDCFVASLLAMTASIAGHLSPSSLRTQGPIRRGGRCVSEMVTGVASTTDDGGYGSLRSQGRRDTSCCFATVTLRELPQPLPQPPRLDRIDLQRDIPAVDPRLRKRAAGEPQARLPRARPHVAKLGRALVESPDTPDSISDSRAEQLREQMIGPLVSGG